MHWRACQRIIRCNAALAFEQIRHWFALIPAMAASNQLLRFKARPVFHSSFSLVVNYPAARVLGLWVTDPVGQGSPLVFTRPKSFCAYVMILDRHRSQFLVDIWRNSTVGSRCITVSSRCSLTTVVGLSVFARVWWFCDDGEMNCV